MRTFATFLRVLSAAWRGGVPSRKPLIQLRLLVAEAYSAQPQRPFARELRQLVLTFEIPRAHLDNLITLAEALLATPDADTALGCVRRAAAHCASIGLDLLDAGDPAAVPGALDISTSMAICYTHRCTGLRAYRAAWLPLGLALIQRGTASLPRLPVRTRLFAALLVCWHEQQLRRQLRAARRPWGERSAVCANAYAAAVALVQALRLAGSVQRATPVDPAVPAAFKR